MNITDENLATALPRRSLKYRLRRTMHRLIDPILSQRNGWRARASLRDLPDGEYRAVPDTVPYVPQFASRELIHAYIHEGLHGKDDPNWQKYGTGDPDQYTFWAHRACAIACLKMAIDSFKTAAPSTMWALIERGLALGGYSVHDASGHFVDVGWYHEPLVALGAEHGLQVIGMSYATIWDICAAIREGWLVAPGVTPEIGEHKPFRKYDGHFVLAYGFTWRSGAQHFLIHNPSGRTPDLQAEAAIPLQRFRAAFAHRFMAFCPTR